LTSRTQADQFCRPTQLPGRSQLLAEPISTSKASVFSFLTMGQAAGLLSPSFPARPRSPRQVLGRERSPGRAHRRAVHGGVFIDTDHPLHRYFVAASAEFAPAARPPSCATNRRHPGPGRGTQSGDKKKTTNLHRVSRWPRPVRPRRVASVVVTHPRGQDALIQYDHPASPPPPGWTSFSQLLGPQRHITVFP